jgi:hypothetical protein
MSNEQQSFLGLLATPEERNKWLTNLLWEHDCEVTFTKVDGSVRTMPCTLRKDAMPAREANTLHETTLYSPETVRVYCLDINEWRSFRVMNVTDVKVL